jgi:hypothetical protein
MVYEAMFATNPLVNIYPPFMLLNAETILSSKTQPICSYTTNHKNNKLEYLKNYRP